MRAQWATPAELASAINKTKSKSKPYFPAIEAVIGNLEATCLNKKLTIQN